MPPSIAAVCGDANVTVAISAASYAGTELTAPPLTFTIVDGVSNLAIAIDTATLDGTPLDALINLVEVCPDGGTAILRPIKMHGLGHTDTGVQIKGV